MGADVSRVRLDPFRDFAGVVLQQGRLLLDADFNEYVALLDRRLRAETSDLTSFGPDPKHAGVSWVPRQTPDGFRVTASGGTLAIGRGRMYVDGLLAENHGVSPTGFDPLLSERTGTADTPYDEQPYWPAPDPLPSGGPHLAYLDVWQREVTHLEDPSLVEIAVGVDTTARLQTAWQVRLLPNVGNATCASDDEDVPGWLDVIRPSAGRLTTGTVDVDPEDDPCALPPSGGYRGLENQTYRVEVHAGGAPGTATFKWSRDNGSVAMPVVEMVSPTVLRLASVGKDDVLRVSTGDWVEILDDRYELGGKPGEIRKVAVDDAARTITFAGAIPTDLRPANAAEAASRHLRVRRWDQAGVVRSAAGATLVDLDAPGAPGLITVPASAGTQVVLEHGIVVSFSLAAGGGRFRPGDHWVFAARTADTSVESLDAAPPLGVHHHYARLGTVTFPGSQTDCRRLWPPLGGGDGGCDCTVCVTPESHSSGALTIQDAVDLVKATGGTVCLAAGVYDVAAGVNADGARSVRIHGQGLATILVARGSALTANRPAGLTVDRLAIVSGAASAAAVSLRSAIATTVQDVAILSFGTADGGGSGVELAGVGLLVALRRNVIVGRTGVDAGAGDRLGLLAADLSVEDNVVVGFQRGVDLGGRSAYLYSCRVERNEVLAGNAGGIVATGAVAPGATLDVTGNKVATSGAGITVGADATVDSNAVNKLAGDPGTDGIVVAPGAFATAPGHVRITGNRVHDRSGTGISLRTAVTGLIVAQNVVANAGAGILVEGRGSAERLAVESNEVLDVASIDVSGAPLSAGILVLHAGSAAVAGNTVARVGLAAEQVRTPLGIAVAASETVRVSGNVVDGVGRPEGFVGVAFGIVVLGPFDTASVSGNSARFAAERPFPEQGGWIAVDVESGASGASLGGAAAPVPVGNDTVVLTHGFAFRAPVRSEHANVGSNILSGGGSFDSCRVQVPGDVVADANLCRHEGEGNGVLLQGSSITASANRVRGGKAMLVLRVAENRFAALGNLATGGTHLGSAGAGLPSPWKPLNPDVS